MNTNNTDNINIKFPKTVLNNDTNTSGIKYKTNHIPINIVKNPIIFVFVSSFNLSFIYYLIIFYNLIIYMTKSRKNNKIKKNKKTRKNNKCVYTDEVFRIKKLIKEFKTKNNLTKKTKLH